LLPQQTGFFRRPGKPIRLTDGPLPYSNPYPSRDGKQIFVLGTKRRGELVRYDMRTHEFKPLLAGISATDPTFSKDGRWVAYASYPDHTLWRSRSDGTERKQLTFPPMDVFVPSISPDGTKVCFYTGKGEIFVISMEGGFPQKVDDRGLYPAWSPDGNYLYYQTTASGGGGLIAEVRTGRKSPVPSSEHMWAIWLAQDTLLATDEKQASFLTFSFKTQKWENFAVGVSNEMFVNWVMSPDGRYLYFTTGGADPKALRLRIADHQLETVASLKDLHRAVNNGDTGLDVAPDGSPIFTRDTGYQEIYALNIRWP
jgi:Tol biopolymer transport system component